MIAIIDYAMGNIGSIVNMLKRASSEEGVVTRDPDVIRSADRIILPGVGAFDWGMKNLKEAGVIDVLNERVLEAKVPVLGICLGMQLLTKRSDEGKLPGLGWIDGECLEFHFDDSRSDLKIPHMGWNTVDPTPDADLFGGYEGEPRFYFVHSFYVTCKDESDIATTTHHGHDFVSSVQRGNIFGTQFHPEKSHKYGMHLLKNFTELT